MNGPDTCTECGAELHGHAFSKRTTAAGRVATCSLTCHQYAQQSNGRGTAYRLAREDERRIVDRMAETLADWTSATSDHDALVRIGAHAIGCSLHDLRAVEIAWIHARAVELAAPVSA